MPWHECGEVTQKRRLCRHVRRPPRRFLKIKHKMHPTTESHILAVISPGCMMTGLLIGGQPSDAEVDFKRPSLRSTLTDKESWKYPLLITKGCGKGARSGSHGIGRMLTILSLNHVSSLHFRPPFLWPRRTCICANGNSRSPWSYRVACNPTVRKKPCSDNTY